MGFYVIDQYKLDQIYDLEVNFKSLNTVLYMLCKLKCEMCGIHLFATSLRQTFVKLMLLDLHLQAFLGVHFNQIALFINLTQWTEWRGNLSTSFQALQKYFHLDFI